MNDTIARLRELFPSACHDRIHLVGGWVRDHLLGRSSSDIDLAAVLDEKLLRARGFRPVQGKSTVPIWFRHDPTWGVMELTLLAGSDRLPLDLERRDFTINAMAMNLEGELVDPLGGRDDLACGRLRACSPRSFRDDPLRILRALRFECDGWRMTEDTEALIAGHDWDRHLLDIPVERFSREMLKALAAPEPGRFFRRMVELGVGRGYLPELFRMPSIPAGPLEHHPEGDLLTHALQVLERVAERSSDPLPRFCAFFHDLGKLATDPSLYPRHHGHDQAGVPLAKEMCTRLRLSARHRTALAAVSLLHLTLNRWDELRVGTKIRTAEQALKGGVANILPIVSAADHASVKEFDGWEEAVAIARMGAAELGIDLQRLEGMPVEQRSDIIHQKRVELMRAIAQKNKQQGE